MFAKPGRTFRCFVIVVAIGSVFGGAYASALKPAHAARPSGRAGPLVSGPVYSQPPSMNGVYYQSSTSENDYDQFVWDNFTIQSTQVITGLQWQGGYDPAYANYAGPLVEFIVSIYATSIAGEPNVAGLPLVEYRTGDRAGETAAGTVGNRTLYEYTYVLPAPFIAAAGTQYWVEIVGFQSGVPNWEIADGMNGNGTHFWSNVNYGGGYSFHWGSGDAAFTLLGPLPPPNTPTPTATRTSTPTPTPTTALTPTSTSTPTPTSTSTLLNHSLYLPVMRRR